MAMDNATPSEETPQITKLRIIKNLVLISLSFFLLFTAYDGLSMLQSTMNKKAGVGVISQAIGYISFCISSFLLPKYLIKKIGCKSSLTIALSFYLPIIAANFFPKWYVMIPSGILGGIGASFLWGSQCTYFNESAFRYARLITNGSVNRNQLSDAPSNRTSVEILSERNSKCEAREENLLKDGPSVKESLELKTSDDSVVKYKCENPSCGNVEKFVVSDIKKNCVQILKNIADSSNSTHTEEEKKSGPSENLPPTGVSSSPARTHGIDVKSQVVDSVEFGTPKRNRDHQPIFQRSSTLESVTGLFFGCHGIAFYSAEICSNVISYYVLKGDDVPPMNYLGGCSCGSQFCNDNPWCVNDDAEYVSLNIRYILTGICVVIASVSVLLVLFFVDPLKKEKTDGEPEKISLRLLSATFRHHKKKEQLCLIPLSFYQGMQQGFYTADFTKSYVACAWSASNVGLVTVFYGCACVISSSTSGFLVKYLGRLPLFILGQLLSISMIAFLVLWNPDSDTSYKFYIASTLFGVITGIYWSQLLAFHGLLFKKDEEAAFSSYYLWSSLGWTTSFSYSDYMCIYVKIYLLLSVSIIGTTGYLFAERSYRLRKQMGTITST